MHVELKDIIYKRLAYIYVYIFGENIGSLLPFGENRRETHLYHNYLVPDARGIHNIKSESKTIYSSQFNFIAN